MAVQCVAFGLVLLSLSQPTSAVRASQAQFDAMPRHLYRSDCFQRRPVVSAHRQSLLRATATVQGKNPGAGIGEVVPFETVLKDGFYMVECGKDLMFEKGDKHGDNKFSYAIGDTANVSIVHYSLVVPKEDQEPMTHSLCFAFCRTVPDMAFFGLTNGRHCYCAPYFELEAGDSSMCDAVCEGAPSTMCGGKSKSSLFSMHSCADTAKNLIDGASSLDAVEQELTEAHSALADASGSMQRAAESFQQAFGQAGDPAASDNMQRAKAFAGEVEHAAAAGEELTNQMVGFSKQAGAMGTSDFTDNKLATEADQLVANMETTTRKGKETLDELEELQSMITPEANRSADAGKEYYSLMYFVDKQFENDTSTCAGEAVGKPSVGTYEDCAASCDANFQSCVGFGHYASGSTGLCFLFSRFTSATHYTACAEKTAKVQCSAKLSAFLGQTLKPDGAGKCKQCLKKVTKADRCFQ